MFLLARSECELKSGVSGICISSTNTFETFFNQNRITSCQKTNSCDVKCCPKRTVWNEDVGKCMIPENILTNQTRFKRVANLQCVGKVRFVKNFDPDSKWIVVNGNKMLTAFLMYDYCVDYSENSFGNATFIAFICEDEYFKFNHLQLAVLIIGLMCFIYHAVKSSRKSIDELKVDKFIFHHWSCVLLAMMSLINDANDSKFLVFFAIMACFSCIIVEVEKLTLLVAVAACVSAFFSVASIFLTDKIVFDYKNIISIVIWFLPMTIPMVFGMTTFLCRKNIDEWTIYFGLWICHLFFPFNVGFQTLFMFSPLIQTVFNFAFYSESHTTDHTQQDDFLTTSV